jgi:hypothetical protein
MGAVVVARTGPLIDPYLPAASASVEIKKACHAGFLSLRTKRLGQRMIERHCERSEAIHLPAASDDAWIASSLRSSQ